MDLAINNNALTLPGAICIGAAAAFGANLTGVNCGPGGNNGYLNGSGLIFTTQQLPVVTLVSVATTTPEPGTLCLFGTAFLLGATYCCQGEVG
ncbi:MAG TPA: hypothetical protein VGL97_04275 [Bryobacteraceae bacterium]